MTPILPPLGLSLVRATQILGAEPYFHDLVEGIEEVTLPVGYPVLLRVLPSREDEAALLERWAQGQQVSGVFLVDLEEGDDRPRLTDDLRLPTVVVGPPDAAHHMTVWTDDDAAMRLAVQFLADSGHQALLHVGGPQRMRHSTARRVAFEQVCASLGIEAFTGIGDYSRESGARAVGDALAEHPTVTGAIFDSDLMALGGLDIARQLGKNVPADLALIAWDDSIQAQLSQPALTTVARNTRMVGRQVGQAMLDLLETGATDLRHATAAAIIPRETTAP